MLRADRLDLPLHWKKPRRIFVNSMSDLFHEDVPMTRDQRQRSLKNLEYVLEHI